MATMLQAVNMFGPKLEHNPTLQLDKASAWMSMRTGINKSEVLMVLQELSELIVYFTTQGTPVKLPGVGTFSTSINRKGDIRVNVRTDQALRNGVNAPGAYVGVIRNKDRVGLNDIEYKLIWDEAYPEDPLER